MPLPPDVPPGILDRVPHSPYTLRFDRETDGRWIAEIPELPGVVAYGRDREEARRSVIALALHVIADRIEHGEATSDEAAARLFEAIAP